MARPARNLTPAAELLVEETGSVPDQQSCMKTHVLLNDCANLLAQGREDCCGQHQGT